MENKNISQLIIGLVIGGIVVGGLFYFQSTNKNIATNDLSVEELFTKKQECLGYEPRVVALINAKNENGSGLRYWEIFYSPKANSCLYVTAQSSQDDLGTTQYWTLNDVLTNQVLFSTTATLGKAGGDSDAFLESLQAYKVEMDKFVGTVKEYGGNGNYAE